MADFVAVIRRAVDGLANNTPDMRAKVYDKARGAVQRQLENMKPRPPEDMLRRQMEKLEAAIVSVESEHSEALAPLAAESEPVPAPVPEAPAPVYIEEPAAEHAFVEPASYDHAGRPAGEPLAAEQLPAEPAYEPHAEAPLYQPAAAESAPVFHEERPVFQEDGYEPTPVAAHAEPPAAATPAYEPPAVEPAAAYSEQPVSATPAFHEGNVASAPVAEEPAAQHYGDWRDDVPPEEPVSPAATFDHVEPAPVEQYDAPIWHEEAAPSAPEETAPVFEPAGFEPAPPAPTLAPPAAIAAPAYEAPKAEQKTFDPLLDALEDDFPYPARGAQSVAAVVPQVTAGWNVQPAFVEPALPIEPEKPVETQAPLEDWGWEPAPAPQAKQDVTAAWDQVPELLPAGPVEPIHHGVHSEAIDAHFDAETHASADMVRMPPVSDIPDLQVPVAVPVAAAVSADPFDDYLAPAPVQQPKPVSKPAESDPWGDLEELIGFNKDATGNSSQRSTLHTDADADDLMPAPARPYRVTPVRKRNYAGILLAIVGLALVGGGGYAIWLNRDSLNDMVDGLIQSSLPGRSQTAQQAPAPSASATPATPRPNSTTPAAPNTPPRNTAANTPAPAPAAPARPTDGSVTGTKFTQRLMTDGSETDQGPGTTGSLAQNAEGQSVAQLNAPPATPRVAPSPAANAPAVPAPAASAPVATPPAATAPTASAAPAATPPVTPAPNTAAAPVVNAPTINPTDTPAVAGEKMFLYEERVGQTAPTAIEGSVSWSLQREATSNGQQQPVVQGRITVPGRGMTALITFKRNTDPSLPASHLIEIVFAVPPDFEGGAIDSVQRIAMKSSEQDRGNALIAVPAKITDDFHMIALNDFPDARATNLELMRTRNWIDIPIAYRNGRRALLTLQKGPAGEKAFNDAIREWGTQGTTPTGQ